MADPLRLVSYEPARCCGPRRMLRFTRDKHNRSRRPLREVGLSSCWFLIRG